MLGAQFPDGFGWIYHSIMNGRRSRTGDYRAAALRAAPSRWKKCRRVIFTSIREGVQINVYAPAQANARSHRGATIRVEQVTRYPFDGRVTVKVNPERTTQVHAGLCAYHPWIGRSAVRINGRKVAAAAGTFHSIAREWAPRGRDRGQHPHAPAPGGARGRGPIHKGEYIDERVPYCAVYKGASAVRDGVAGYAGRAATPSLCGTGSPPPIFGRSPRRRAWRDLVYEIRGVRPRPRLRALLRGGQPRG